MKKVLLVLIGLVSSFTFVSCNNTTSSSSNSLSNSSSSDNSSINNNPNNEEFKPQLSTDGKTITYGLYPQSYVKDSSLISVLDSLEPLTNNWYLYEGNYYYKDTASTFNGLGYVFNDNASITNGKEYWFKCEAITWNVINVNEGLYTLVSNMLLDAKVYYKDYEDRVIDGNTISPNNYQYSDVREFLNNEF